VILPTHLHAQQAASQTRHVLLVQRVAFTHPTDTDRHERADGDAAGPLEVRRGHGAPRARRTARPGARATARAGFWRPPQKRADRAGPPLHGRSCMVAAAWPQLHRGTQRSTGELRSGLVIDLGREVVPDVAQLGDPVLDDQRHVGVERKDHCLGERSGLCFLLRFLSSPCC
jgi:hypothetical protein